MMRTAAMALGITGGVLGAILAIFGVPFATGLYSDAFTWEASLGTAAVLTILILFVVAAAIVGGALAKSHQMASYSLLLVAALAGFFVVAYFWIVPGILLFIGAGLEMGSKR